MRRRKIIVLTGTVLIACAAIALLTVHSGTSPSVNQSEKRALGGASHVAAPPVRGNASAGSAQAGGTPAVNLAQAKPPAGSAVTRNGSITIEAKNLDDALQRTTDIVHGAGGHVFSSSTSSVDDPSRHLHAEFKVPPDAFDEVMKRLSGVGKVTASETSTEDVTGQVVDLDARLAAARTSAQRLRDLLAHSANVGDLLQVENTLSQRESEVESLDAQSAALHAKIAESTITVDLTAVAAVAAPTPSHHIPGFLAGLRTGAAALANTVLVASTALGFVLPFLLPVALFALLVRRLRRRRQPGAAAA